MFLNAAHISRFALHDLGGDGPAVLICHATGFCGRAYEPLARVLAADFHVWALDFPGHGDSDPPAGGDFSWRKQIPHLLLAKQTISPDAPLGAIVGHSMGAAVALQAAAEHAGLCHSLYAYEPAMSERAVPGRMPGSNPMSEAARRRQGTFPSKSAALWRYSSRPPLNKLEASSLAAYVEHGFRELDDGTVALKCTPENEAATFESSGDISVATVTASEIPTLCVAGGEPHSPLAAVVPILAASLPEGAARTHRYLGHFGPLESPALIGADIAAHVRGVLGHRLD